MLSLVMVTLLVSYSLGYNHSIYSKYHVYDI